MGACRLLAASLVVLAGCESIVGIQDWTDPSTSSSGAGGDSSSSGSVSTTSGSSSSSSTTAASSTGTGGCTVVCTMDCFGGPCDCETGTCLANTVAIPNSIGVFVKAGMDRLSVATNDGANTGHVGDLLKQTPQVPTDDWTGFLVTAFTADATNRYATIDGGVWSIPFTGSNIALTTNDLKVSAWSLAVIQFGAALPQLCFLRPTQQLGGGLYCQSTTTPQSPTQIGSADFPLGLTSDGTVAYTAHQAASGSPMMFSMVLPMVVTGLGNITGPMQDVSYDAGVLYYVTANGTLYTMSSMGGPSTPHGTIVANAQRLKVHGNYVYARSNSVIMRMNKSTFDPPQVVADESGSTISDFDVDAGGVYWGMPGVGVRMRGLSSL